MQKLLLNTALEATFKNLADPFLNAIQAPGFKRKTPEPSTAPSEATFDSPPASKMPAHSGDFFYAHGGHGDVRKTCPLLCCAGLFIYRKMLVWGKGHKPSMTGSGHLYMAGMHVGKSGKAQGTPDCQDLRYLIH